MSQSIQQWWKIIVDHYGTLEGFDDATTVRTMRDQCRLWIADDIGMVLILEDHAPEDLPAYDKSMEADRKAVSQILNACSSWLKKRGLK